ncbi:MAG: cytochrome b/b6 domain-containing protein [Gammaproteobacteria bacterium]|nr:cytochrome b/b6 domain-containing protein [Gammaproteobacteria bacterium]
MSALYRPNPEALSAAERTAMAERQLKKHDVAAILLHWFNALVWLAQLITGTALIVAERYVLVPVWFREIVLGLFGSGSNMLRFHIVLGVLWAGVLLIYGLFGFRHYLLGFLKKDLLLDRDDLRWLRNRPLRILGRDVPLPEQGIYNAGQKAYAWVVVFGTAAIIATGFIMAFHLGPQWLIQWSLPVHFLAVGGVVAGLIVHIYMAGILPEERPAFFSMFNGKVNELYAYEHHTKWWRRRKEEKRRFHAELESEFDPEGSNPATRTPP